MAINKVRGDRFLAACTLENRGDTDLSINVKIIAFSGNRTLDLGSFTDVLGKGKTKRYPESDYAGKTIPSDWPVGVTGCRVEVDYNGKKTSKEVSDAWNVGHYVELISVNPSKTTLNPDESYTLRIYYSVDQGTYSVFLDGMEIGRFDTLGESGYRDFSLRAPSSPGTYTFNVKLQRLYTGESSTKSYTITVVKPIVVKLISVTPSKSTLYPNESYTLSVTYEVSEGTYSIWLDGLLLDRFTTSGESKTRTYSLRAPSSTGSYTYYVKLERMDTWESSTKSYTISVVTAPPTYSGYLSNVYATAEKLDTQSRVKLYATVNVTSGTGYWIVRVVGYYTDQAYRINVTSVPYSSGNVNWLTENLPPGRTVTYYVELYAPDGSLKDRKSYTITT